MNDNKYLLVNVINRELYSTTMFGSHEGEDNDCIVSRDVILDYAIYQIQNDRLYLARHVLDAVDTDYADWYNYDASMGTLETPTPVDNVNDLYDYVED